MTTPKESSLIAACDSQVFMWALPWAMPEEKKAKKTAGQDVAQMRKRATWMMLELQEKKIELYVPAIILAELLAGVEPAKHATLTAEFSKRFVCVPFDTKSCELAAKLWQFERGAPGGTPGLPDEERSQRRILKADVLIVACAKEAGVQLFYSHDEKCRRLAKQAGMTPHDLPKTSGKLFETGAKADVGSE